MCLFDPVPGIVPQEELAAEADVFPLRACCSFLARWRPDDEDRKQLLLVDGTTRPTRPDPTIHTPHEPPKKKRRRAARADDQTNTPTSSTSGATRVAPRAVRDTSHPSYAGAQRRRMSTNVHGTTCAQAREPARRDDGLANDVRVSPTDEGASAAPREEM